MFLSLFNRQGYVLDFTTNDFDSFTTTIVGIPLCEKYGTSKGKSLTSYINSAAENEIKSLILALFERYENNYVMEYTEDADEYENYGHYHKYDPEMAKLYQCCKSVVQKVRGINTGIESAAKSIKTEFSNEYLSKQIDAMIRAQTDNPTDAIGKAKELIESCCKTVLENMKIQYSEKWDLPKLADTTLDALNLLPKNVNETDRGADSIKAILGNLRGIVSKMGELRNPFGSGHGKSNAFVGLEARHAKLAVGCSITFTQFVWDTYLLQKDGEEMPW